MNKVNIDLDKSAVYVFVTQEHFIIPGAIVADNFGAGLTPEQIRERMDEYNLLASNLQIPIVLLTTNHTAINEMKDAEEYLFVWKNGIEGATGKWIPVTEMYSEDWLAHFDLGDLYERGYFTGHQE